MIKQQRYGGIGVCLAAALAVAVSACGTFARHQEAALPPAHNSGSAPSVNTNALPALVDNQPRPWMAGRIAPIGEAAAPDSVEERLRSEGRSWEMAPGPVQPGAYVKDILQGRMDQPEGRGTIGKVTSVDQFGGVDNAWVDFGRGCVKHIHSSELCPVKIIEPATPMLR
ncbi:MAG: hypothetical protein ABSG04_08490 [Verrucomicrobiota bacterium]